jgi:hypothetical protein
MLKASETGSHIDSEHLKYSSDPDEISEASTSGHSGLYQVGTTLEPDHLSASTILRFSTANS